MESRWRVLLGLSFSALALIASRAFPAAIEPELSATRGPANFQGWKADAAISQDEFILTPAYSSFSSDLTSGTFRTISARAGFQGPQAGGGLTIGGTPEVDGYSNTFVRIDGRAAFDPAASEDAGSFPACRDDKPCLRLGASLSHIEHQDQFAAATSATAGRSPFRIIRRTTGALHLGQTDLGADARLYAARTAVSGFLTKSFYDKNLSAVSARVFALPDLGGLASLIELFPDFSAGLNVQNYSLDPLEPFLSLSHTTFELTNPATAATAGFDVAWGRLILTASYTFYVQSGIPGLPTDQNYYTLGARASFGGKERTPSKDPEAVP